MGVITKDETAKETWKPRNDWLLVEIIDVDETDSGIALPQISIEGKRFRVVSVGPKVEDLKPDDWVLMIGQRGSQFYPLPGSSKLLVIQQQHVVLVEKM